MDFFINQHADQKISSAQNTILCREWLLQKLTFRHSEITIFNHSHNPTQRTFGEPQAPSVYIYIYVYICIWHVCVCVCLLPLFYPKWWNTHAEKAGMQRSKSPQTVPLVQATHNGHGAGNANTKGLKQQWNGHRHLKPASSSSAPHTDWTLARIGISQ